MRHIAVAIGGRANWGSLKTVVQHLLEWESVGICKVTVLRYGAACSRWYGRIDELGPYSCVDIPCLVDSESPQAMAMHAGLIMIAVGQELERLEPDVVLVCGDRYDVLPVAYAAALQNRVIAHTMGGEHTGSIDESVRWAITSLAHWHFPATARAAQRIQERGEARVFLAGCPRIDLAAQAKHDPSYEGAIVVLQHGVTTEQPVPIPWLRALHDRYAGKRRLIWIWPNSDYGSPQIAQAARAYLEGWELHRNLTPDAWMTLLASCGVLVGNSSSGIREGAYLGTPVVQLGTRQRGREVAGNVLLAEVEVLEAVEFQLRAGRFAQSALYGDGTAGKQIASILAHQPLPPVQK